MENLATISELAKKHSITLRTIRFWEGKGLVKPVPRDSNRRFYTEAENVYVGVLVRLKKCGMSLHDMKFWRGAGPSMQRKLLEKQRDANAAEMDRLVEAQEEVSKMLLEIGGAEISRNLKKV